MIAVLIHGATKRSVMARIAQYAAAAGESDALYGVQVSAALPPEPERKCVYGGRLRFARQRVLAEFNVANQQTITFDIRIRVVDLGDDIDGTERVAEDIERAVAAAVEAPPALAGGFGTVTVVAGDADPTILVPGPEPTITVNRVLTVEAVIAQAGV